MTTNDNPITPAVPCSLATLGRPHTAHDWRPQSGMNPVHCPGTAAVGVYTGRQQLPTNAPTTPDTVTRVEIDPNVRVHGNLGRAGLEDADGPLTVGQDVTVYEPESGLTGPGRVVRIDTDKQLVFLAVQWSELRPAEAPHACSNCEGVDPDTCLANPDRPRGGQPAPAPDPALAQRIADAIGPNMLIGLQDADLWGSGGTERIQEWIDWIGKTLAEKLAPELARAEKAEVALAAGIPLICTDERHQAKTAALEAQVRRLGDLIDRLGPTEQKHRDDLATARAILADLTDPDPCWYDHHGYCQAHAWLATTPACPHARAKALTQSVAPEDTP